METSSIPNWEFQESSTLEYHENHEDPFSNEPKLDLSHYFVNPKFNNDTEIFLSKTESDDFVEKLKEFTENEESIKQT